MSLGELEGVDEGNGVGVEEDGVGVEEDGVGVAVALGSCVGVGAAPLSLVSDWGANTANIAMLKAMLITTATINMAK
jgi:hypothetical protein